MERLVTLQSQELVKMVAQVAAAVGLIQVHFPLVALEQQIKVLMEAMDRKLD
mgnify:CR=1 FL=1